MSAFIGGSASNGPLNGSNLGMNDESVQPPDYRLSPPFSLSLTPHDTDWLWPRSQMLGTSAGVLNPDPAAQAWEWNVYATGQHTRKRVTGQTLNAAGAPLGGVTVILFNTPTNVVVDTGVSDAAGNYSLGDPNATTNFVVGYLPGSPDVAGTTVDTISGV